MLRFNMAFNLNNKRIPIKFNTSANTFKPAFSHFQKVVTQADYEYYTGDYDVTPKVDPQSLATKDKFLTDNVRIESIPYYDVSNESGGSTVYIGTLEELISASALFTQ